MKKRFHPLPALGLLALALSSISWTPPNQAELPHTQPKIDQASPDLALPGYAFSQAAQAPALKARTATPTPGFPPSSPPRPTPRQTATRTPGLPMTATPIISDRVDACPGAPPITIRTSAWAQNSLHPPISTNVRRDPGLKGDWIGRIKPGEPVWVQAGPRCADHYTWWFVRSLSGLEGWMAEGDAKAYWLLQPMEAFFYDTASPEAGSKAVLSRGQKYRITLAGTYSLWVAEQWTDRGVCIRGPSELRPMYPSPDKVNGPVGADPYYRFARPFYGPCQGPADQSELLSPLKFSLDGGKSFLLPPRMTWQYRGDHTYTYEVTGQGYPLKVRLDDAPLEDNYGQIFVTIEEVE